MVLSNGARHFLEERRFAVLATLQPDGSPLLTVVWYLLRNDHVLMYTAGGLQKERNLRRDQRASICVEDGYCYVSISGEVMLVDDEATTRSDITALAARYLDPDRAEAMVRDVFTAHARVSVYLPLTHIYERGVDAGSPRFE